MGYALPLLERTTKVRKGKNKYGTKFNGGVAFHDTLLSHFKALQALSCIH